MFSIRSWLKARYYDAVLERAEQLFLGSWREKLLKDVSGVVLEVGSGTGANTGHYSAAVTSLVLTEPDYYMRKQLRLKLGACDARHVEVQSSVAESLDFPDSSFDCVVSTLVLCSVVDQHRSLTEFRRVLRPGGKLVFLEHVAAAHSSSLYHWQKILQPVWRIFSCNCHLARDTEAMILGAGFQIVEIERTSMREMPAVVRPVIKGVALAGTD